MVLSLTKCHVTFQFCHPLIFSVPKYEYGAMILLFFLFYFKAENLLCDCDQQMITHPIHNHFLNVVTTDTRSLV